MRSTRRSAVLSSVLLLFPISVLGLGSGEHVGAAKLPLAGLTIVIDPGHNGGNATYPSTIARLVDAGGFLKACDTAGTVTLSGYPEHAFAWSLSLTLGADLKAAGAKVVLTRTNDHGVGPCIAERAAIGNRVHADLAISLHGDGGPPWGRGFEVIEPGISVSRRNDDRPILHHSYALGAALRDALQTVPQLVPSTYLGEHGVGLRTDLGGLNLSKVPKVLLEVCNLRNSADADLAQSPEWRQEVALALVGGVERYRGAVRSPTTTSTVSPTTTTTGS